MLDVMPLCAGEEGGVALWQFDFWLVPTALLVDRYGAMPSSLTESEFESVAWWAEAHRAELEGYLDSLLTRADSFSADNRLWGSWDGNRLQLFEDDDGRYAELFGRIDLRTSCRPFIEQLVQLALSLNAVFVTADCDLVQPSQALFVEAVSTSRAFRFVSDPSGFIERLARERETIDPDGAA